MSLKQNRKVLDKNQLVKNTHPLGNLPLFQSAGFFGRRHELQKIENKHKWSDESVDTLLHKYMSCRKALSKLFMYEMEIINNLIQMQFSVNLFNKKDNKET